MGGTGLVGLCGNYIVRKWGRRTGNCLEIWRGFSKGVNVVTILGGGLRDISAAVHEDIFLRSKCTNVPKDIFRVEQILIYYY